MFTFNSYLILRYWLRERIILWGFGGSGDRLQGKRAWIVGGLESRIVGELYGALERRNDLVLEGSRVGELYGRFRIG